MTVSADRAAWLASYRRGPNAIMLAKSCNDCGQFLDQSDFCKDANRKDKLNAICRQCSTWAYKRSMYGVSREFFLQVLAEQGGGCRFCGGCTPDPADMHLDHDHECCPGMMTCGDCVRGILCFNCNAQLVSAYEKLPPERRTWQEMNVYLASRARPALRVAA